jgi:uncharacterized repeat protein (TIGR03803 family)
MTNLQVSGLLTFAGKNRGKGYIAGQVGLWTAVCIVLALCASAMAVSASPATTTFATLLSFDGIDGENPAFNGSLVQGFDGNFYGTTYNGGANGSGTFFEITPSGTVTTIYNFCGKKNCIDGSHPAAALVLDTNGDFYGTTMDGGGNLQGTVFKITPAGTLTTLHSFCAESDCADGAYPLAGLVLATSGNFYGTTNEGGANQYGAIFEITPTGKFTSLYSFCSQTNCTDGESPYAGLIQATNGNLYGTTYEGGANQDGTIFEITLAGQFSTFYSFCSVAKCADGENPNVGLIQAANGNFYGATSLGGANASGTVFEITTAGTLTTLHSFCAKANCADGASPNALVQATSGNFYGTTLNGTTTLNDGTVFEITPTGTLTTLHVFNGTNGATPVAALLQATNGDFYGTTYGGGAGSDGTVFSLAVGLGPFVQTLPTSASAGAQVIILGTDLTGATSVTFNGTAATFTVVSATEITTTVPTGATTGTVVVTTPSGTLKSNVVFQVGS